MSSHLPAAARPAAFRPAVATLVLVVTLTACGTTTPSPSPSIPASPSSTSAVASPSALPSQGPPTPQPTPTYTNPPDPDLAGLIPTRLRGATVVVPPTSEFAMTPGDFASAYGDLGLQFRALQAVSYTHLTLPTILRV